MGAGLAKQCADRFPEVVDMYKVGCHSGLHSVAATLFIQRRKEPHVICFATKHDWRNPSKIEYIEWGLKDIVANYRKWKVKSIAIPKLGCGLGGLDYQTQVRPLLIKYLPLIRIPIRLYI